MGRLLTQPLAHCVDRPGDGRPEPIQGRALLGLIFVSWVPGERQNASKEAVMTDRPTTEPPIGVPEADLLEQRATIDWPELPVDQVTVPRAGHRQDGRRGRPTRAGPGSRGGR